MSENWRIDGTYFESCNCDVACPCVFTSAPTEGECEALVAWHIDSGNYGSVSLDGLSVALAVYSPGHMLQTPWKVALYTDDKANAAQSEALVAIFGGQAGGHIASLSGLIGEILGVKSASMEYHGNGRQRSLSIEGVADVAIVGMAGQGDADVAISNHPVAIAPGFSALAATSEKFSYQDHGYHWEFSGKSGFYSPFSYAGP